MERPDLCKGCNVHCCTRPTFYPEEYIRISEIIGNDVMTAAKPKWVPEAGGFIFEGTCPCISPTGCTIPYEQRAIICRSFPFLMIPVISDRAKGVHFKFLLDVERCPNWKAFGDNYDRIKEEFEKDEYLRPRN